MGAAVVLKPGHRATVQEIRAYAFSKMTAEKVPSQVIFLKDIPKGPTGKLQRIGLADKLQKQLNPEFVSPKTSVEIRLAEIWQDVLPVQKVGKQDNFFLLGGDSLSAAQVISRIKNHFGIFISLKKVFEGPTLTKQAAMIEKVLAEQIEDMTEKEAKEQLQQLKNK